MTHELNVRDATVGERPEVAEVTRRAYLEFAQSSDPAFWAGYEASSREVLLEDDESRRVVVTMDGRIVPTVLYALRGRSRSTRCGTPSPRCACWLSFRSVAIASSELS